MLTLHRVRFALLALLLAALAPPAITTPARAVPIDGEWLQIALPLPVSPPPPARTSFSLVLDTARNRLIAFGGDPGPKQDTWVLALAPDSAWHPLVATGAPPSTRYGHSAIYDPVGDRMIVFGGWHGTQLSDVWTLSLSGTPQWAPLASSGTPPSTRQDAAVVYDAVNQRMVVFGGYRATGGFLNDSWALTLTGTPTWAPIPAAGAPSVRGSTLSALDISRNRLVVFGGWDGTSFLSDTWELDLAAGGAWSPILTANAPSARRNGAAIYDALQDRILIFGGLGAGYASDTWQLSRTGTPDWSLLPPLGQTPAARSGTQAAYDAVHDRMVIFAGYLDTWLNDTWRLELDGTNAWHTLVGDPITPRRDVAAVYNPDADEMVIFGGTGAGSQDGNDTWRLELPSSPSTHRWERVEPIGAPPTERHGHRAVWDAARHRMLVVGGYAGGTYANDVWELASTPAPTWHRLDTQGAPPQGRMLFGLALDPIRDRLILVGGHSGFPPFHAPAYWGDVWELPLSGPNALTWAPVSVLGTPPDPQWIYAMRYDPLRDQMVFFGGVSATGRTNQVWALHLSGPPTWELIAPAGSPPSPRSDHAMVYDAANDRMVVFGGYDGTFRGDTWAFTLSGPPQWQALSPTGVAPSARDIIDAIYEPLLGRMVLFGGWNNTGVLVDTWQLTWGSQPTAIEASLIESHAAPDRVSLGWYVRDASSVQAEVQRRADGGGWAIVGTPATDGAEILRYDDTDVVPGARYGYRLRLRQNGEETLTSETEIVVPSGAMLALAGARPNPTQGGPLRVSFALARAGDGRLELLDVSGRRVASRSLDGLAPGTHHVMFSEASRAEPGVYLLRLVTPERTLTAKAMITR